MWWLLSKRYNTVSFPVRLINVLYTLLVLVMVVKNSVTLLIGNKSSDPRTQKDNGIL